jgi:hypothetical protein
LERGLEICSRFELLNSVIGEPRIPVQVLVEDVAHTADLVPVMVAISASVAPANATLVTVEPANHGT